MPLFIVHGISYYDFWSFTQKEIISIAYALRDKQKQEYKSASWIAYVQACITGSASNGKVKKYHTYFPENNDETADTKLKRQLLELANNRKTKK